MQDEKNVRFIFIAGTLYFLLSAIYSLLNYKLEFLLDGFALIYDIANDQKFPDAAQREVMWLTQIIPVVLAKLHVSLKGIMAGYILNVFLLFYLLFAVICLWLKDFYCALFYLIIQMYGQIYNYFFVVGELMPGMCFAILAISLFMHGGKKGMGINVLLAALILLVVRSHPLASICLLIGLVIVAVVERDYAELSRAKLVTAFSVFILASAVKLWTLNRYDASVLEDGKNLSFTLWQLAHPQYMAEMLYYLFTVNFTFTACFLFSLACFISSKKYKLLALTVILLIAGMILLNMVRDFSHIYVWDLQGIRRDRWSLPIRFTLFFVFILYCLRQEFRNINPQFVKACVLLMFLPWWITVFEVSEKARLTVSEHERIIETARAAGCRKCIVDMQQFNIHGFMHKEAFYNTLVLSSLENPLESVQIIYSEKENIPAIENIEPARVMLMNYRYIYNREELNKRYFNLPIEKYRYLPYTGDHRKP